VRQTDRPASLLKLPVLDKDDMRRHRRVLLARRRHAGGFGETVVVDTTHPMEPAVLLRGVEDAFSRCFTRLAADDGQ
jgi:hypothetical protein